jgi:hypothetical protein
MSVNPADPNGPPHYYDQNNRPDPDDPFLNEEPKIRSKHQSEHMATSNKLNPVFMMMIILQIRSVITSMKKYGVPVNALKAAIYTILRIDLSGKISDQAPGTIESFQLALDDVKNFNDVADKLFEAYAKDRSICRDGLTTVLTGDNFTITLNMSSPNSVSNVSGQSSK